MEAQKIDPKPRRMSDLSFEPGFTIEIQMAHIPARNPLDKEMVIMFLMGIDKRNPWFAPNEGLNDPDPIQIEWISDPTPLGGKLRCTHERSVVCEKHFDAYLRYIQTIGRLLFQYYLQSLGVTHVSVLLELTTFVKEFSTASGGGMML